MRNFQCFLRFHFLRFFRLAVLSFCTTITRGARVRAPFPLPPVPRQVPPDGAELAARDRAEASEAKDAAGDREVPLAGCTLVHDFPFGVDRYV